MRNLSLIASSLLFLQCVAFSPQFSSRLSLVSLSSVPASGVETTEKGLLKRDRYIATNRFAVRRDKQAKFEQRWANRKSRLAILDGFRYFHLMRRVTLDGTYDEGDTEEAALENYVSITVWNKKSDFSAWRKGDAFKEAHGGTSIGAFLSTMVNSAFVLRGPPRPAFYDALFVTSKPPTDLPETVDGWRAVEADGASTLPAECFVYLEKYYVPQSKAAEFEMNDTWKNKKSSLEDTEGLVTFSLMRRDGQAKGHGTVEMDSSEPTYVAAYIFQDRPSFDAWAKTVEEVDMAPEKVYYEGTLVISSADGA